MRDELVAHVLELLASLGSARARRMFGGHGIDVDGLFLALIADGRLYLKTDDLTRARFDAAGCEPFSYRRAGGLTAVMSYSSAPEDAMESAERMAPWARLALEAALRARTAPRSRTSARAPRTTSDSADTPPPTPASRLAGRRR